jgi:hypothetical protein
MPSQFSRELDTILASITKSDGSSGESAMANGISFGNVYQAQHYQSRDNFMISRFLASYLILALIDSLILLSNSPCR